MTTQEYIDSIIGNKVYITPYYDIMFDGSIRNFVRNKTHFTLLGVSKKGLAILELHNKKYYVKKRNIKQVIWIQYTFKTPPDNVKRKYPYQYIGFSSDYVKVITYLPEYEVLTNHWKDAVDIETRICTQDEIPF